MIDETVGLFEAIADEHEACERSGVNRVMLSMGIDVVGHCSAVKAGVRGFEFPSIDIDLLKLSG